MVSAESGTMACADARVGSRGSWRHSVASLLTALLMGRPRDGFAADDESRRPTQVRYHLGRARRAREAGQYRQAIAEARQALEWNANDPWVLALLGQCLHRQPATDLVGARAALEKAWSLDPTNGYFVGLLLDVLDDQGDTEARADLLTWAWWRGAPVERWLPGGPDMPAAEAAATLVAATRMHEAQPAAAVTPRAPERRSVGRRPAMPAHA